MTSVNIVTLASLAWSPEPPIQVMIGGIVSPSTHLRWDPASGSHLAGYKVYWRQTHSPVWQHSLWAGRATTVTLENIIIDDYVFGVASVSQEGHESLVQFPVSLIPKSPGQ